MMNEKKGVHSNVNKCYKLPLKEDFGGIKVPHYPLFI